VDGLYLVHAADPRGVGGAADQVAVLLHLPGDGLHGSDELVEGFLLSVSVGSIIRAPWTIRAK
jgi:hypothetical protein